MKTASGSSTTAPGFSSTNRGGATVPASGRPSRSEEQPEGMKPDALSPEVKQPGVQPGAQPSPHQGHAAPSAAPAPSGKIQIAPAQLNVRPAGR